MLSGRRKRPFVARLDTAPLIGVLMIFVVFLLITARWVDWGGLPARTAIRYRNQRPPGIWVVITDEAYLISAPTDRKGVELVRIHGQLPTAALTLVLRVWRDRAQSRQLSLGAEDGTPHHELVRTLEAAYRSGLRPTIHLPAMLGALDVR